MVIVKQKLFHVGSLDASKRNSRFSYEGDSLSVSECPHVWREIAKLNGMCWALESKKGVFLDMTSAKVISALTELSLNEGLTQKAACVKAFYEDHETGSSMYTMHSTLAEAQLEYDEEEVSFVQEVELISTHALKEAYPVAPAHLYGSLALTIATVVMSAQGSLPFDVDGLWWEEALAPNALSAPRGCVFAHRVPYWSKFVVS